MSDSEPDLPSSSFLRTTRSKSIDSKHVKLDDKGKKSVPLKESLTELSSDSEDSDDKIKKKSDNEGNKSKNSDSEYDSANNSEKEENFENTKKSENSKLKDLKYKDLKEKNRSLKKSLQSEKRKSANFNNRNENPNNMTNIPVGDLITAIPMFDGNLKKLDQFINTGDVYNSIVEEAQKNTLLAILKTKIAGEALEKVRPIDDINTWNNLKTRLKDRLRKPLTFEYAQEDLNSVFQKKDENLMDFGNRVKEKLRKINEVSSSLSANNDALAVVRSANEKIAIAKFQQNIRDENIKILVSAASKTSLDDSISFALQVELMRKNSNLKHCSICNGTNHDTNSCFQRNKNNDQTRKNFSASNKSRFNQNNFGNRSFGSNNYRNYNNSNKNFSNDGNRSNEQQSNSNSYNTDFRNRNNTNYKSNSGQSNNSFNDQNKNQPKNDYQNKNNQRSIKTAGAHEPDVSITTLADILNVKMVDESTKNI